MHCGAETEPAYSGGNGVRNGDDSYRMVGGHRKEEQRREQTSNAEAGHGCNRPRQNRSCSNEPRGLEDVSSSGISCCLTDRASAVLRVKAKAHQPDSTRHPDAAIVAKAGDAPPGRRTPR